MPRRKAETEEQANAPKKLSAKDKKKHQQMEDDLERTLAKHREEIARMSAELKPAQPVEIADQPEQDVWGEPDGQNGEAEEKLDPLQDPTKGQDLTHNVDLTMEEFFSKTLSLLMATTNAVRTMEYRHSVTARKVEALTRQLRHRDALEKALGFRYTKEGTWYTPRLKQCPHCGRMPSLQREKGGKGWLVICDECWTRAETADGPMAAVKNWNEGKETEISKMVNRPLTEI